MSRAQDNRDRMISSLCDHRWHLPRKSKPHHIACVPNRTQKNIKPNKHQAPRLTTPYHTTPRHATPRQATARHAALHQRSPAATRRKTRTNQTHLHFFSPSDSTREGLSSRSFHQSRLSGAPPAENPRSALPKGIVLGVVIVARGDTMPLGEKADMGIGEASMPSAMSRPPFSALQDLPEFFVWAGWVGRGPVD